MFKNVINIKRIKSSIKHFSTILFDSKALQNYKDTSSHFRETIYHHVLYDLSLKNLLNSMYIITKQFDTVVFIGPNPDCFLLNTPSSIDKN